MQFYQTLQKRNSQAHICRLHDYRVPRRGANFRFVFGRQCCGAQHVNDPRLGGKCSQFNRQRRRGKIDNGVGVRDCGQRIVTDQNAGIGQAGKAGAVRSQFRMAWPDESSGKLRAFVSCNRRISARPILPAAPATTTRQVLIAKSVSDFRVHSTAWTSGKILCMARARRCIGYGHHRGPQQPVANHITGLDDTDDRARRLSIARHLGDRLMRWDRTVHP